MSLIFIFICVLFAIKIVNCSGKESMYWFLIALMFLPPTIGLLDKPVQINSARLFIYVLIYATYIQKKIGCNSDRFPLKILLYVTFVALLIVEIFAPELFMFLNIYRAVTSFLESFFIVYLSYSLTRSKTDFSYILRKMYLPLFIICLYGIINYLLKYNPYDSFICEIYHIPDFISTLAGSERFRITSFFSHSMSYGYVLCIFILYFITQRETKNNLFIYTLFVLFLCLNLLLTDSRTCMISLFIGLFVYFILDQNLKSKIRVVLGMFIIVPIGLSIPIIQDKVDSFLDMFADSSEIQGSNMSMRIDQTAASYVLFEKKPIVGHGIYYIQEGLGYSNDSKKISDAEFHGFESYLYTLMIEQGCVGILTVLFFHLGLIWYFYKNRKIAPSFSILGISTVFMFIFFSLGTGVMGAYPITLVFIGIFIKSIQLSKNEKIG